MHFSQILKPQTLTSTATNQPEILHEIFYLQKKTKLMISIKLAAEL